jgi:hypothetical protein
MCGEQVPDDAEYWDIDSGDCIVCDECYKNMSVNDAVDLFCVEVSDILDMHDVNKKTNDNKPSPEPPIPGQIEITDDGQLREYKQVAS